MVNCVLWQALGRYGMRQNPLQPLNYWHGIMAGLK